MKTTKRRKIAAAKSEPARSGPARAALATTQGPRFGSEDRPAWAVQAAPGRPEVAKTGLVSLELVRSDAQSVCVAGSFNEWKPERTPLTPAGQGRWKGDLCIRPGRHEYLFVVDGQWLPDPNAKESVENPFGGRNSVLIVSE
jgi:hypothetical protein